MKRPCILFLARFFSSGLFFILYGSAFLLLADIKMYSSHSGFSFVLVVVGVALVLFGTGTQSNAVGKLSPADQYSFRFKLAGGASVLAGLVGIGIVVYHVEIGKAFAPKVEYTELTLRLIDPENVNVIPFDQIQASVYSDGRRLPVYWGYQEIKVLIPSYGVNEYHNAKLRLFATSDKARALIRHDEEIPLTVTPEYVGERESRDGGSRFVYPRPHEIVAMRTGAAQPPIAPDTVRTENSTPAHAEAAFERLPSFEYR